MWWTNRSHIARLRKIKMHSVINHIILWLNQDCLSNIYTTFVMCVIVCFLLDFVFSFLPQKTKINFGYNQFGYRLFSSLWVGFSYMLMLEGFIVVGCILWLSDLILTRPLYETIFVSKNKEEIPLK
jgi:hypothetical protein